MATALLASLAQETRLEVFRCLVRAGHAGAAAGQIASELDVPPPTLSFHLKELRHAGVVDSERQGRSIIYRANFPAVRALVRYLTENCCQAPQTQAGGNCCTAPLAVTPAAERETHAPDGGQSEP